MSIDRDEADLALDAVIVRRHADAAAGDPHAAGELGRMLCLLPPDGSLTAWDWLAPEWPAEPWLRAALASRPDDVDTAALLAGLLTQRLEIRLLVLQGGSDAAATALQHEATALCSRILRRDPQNTTANACLAAIHEVLASFNKPAEDLPAHTSPVSGHSFYVGSWSFYSGSAGWDFFLVATDPREFRWAFDWVLRSGLEDLSPATALDDAEPLITVYSSGEPVTLIRLEPYLGRSAKQPVDWAEFTLPSLTGEPLPVGHPPSDLDERLAFYGFSEYHRY